MINNAAIVDALPAHWVAKVRPYSAAPANAARAAGVSANSVQVINADTVWDASRCRPPPTCRATTGMTTPASTPPATISNSTFGNEFAAL